MQSASKPKWQQMTALVSLSTGGAITGFSLVPGTAAPDLTSPAGTQIRLLALHQSARPAVASDATLRTAIVNVAHYYLRIAQGKTPAEMEALIWQHDSIDGVDHGESCAAFASLTLELAAQVVGQQSWVTGGTTYPWPLHKWADVRVDPNPASPGIISVLQDAESHQRWHPLGDGYRPLPGDWVLFNGHVEVVTSYSGGVLHTIGGDSLPNLSVNAHAYSNPLSAQGVAGFVNNGELSAAAVQPQASGQPASVVAEAGHHHQAGGRDQAPAGQAAIPGAPSGGATATAPPPHGPSVAATPAPGPSAGGSAQPAGRQPRQIRERTSAAGQAPAEARRVRQKGLTATPQVPGTAAAGPVATLQAAAQRGAAPIPGLSSTAHRLSDGAAARHKSPYSRHQPAAAITPPPDASAQQVFISSVAPGAMAAQRTYGVPAAVTIAQAIDESGWGQSYLATKDHNLFGIKGSGPAGSDLLPTQEYENGQMVQRTASFRVYQSVAQSIDDHGRLLATSQYYTQSMAQRHDPNAFANALTGVYATDPAYGPNLISLMQRFNLYRYDTAAPSVTPRATAPHAPASRQPGGVASTKPTVNPGGVTSPTPGVTSPTRVGAAKPKPGATSPERGVTSPSPGVTSPSPGVTSPSPGVTSPERGGASSPEPGVNPGGATSSRPGRVTRPKRGGATSPKPEGVTRPKRGGATSPNPGGATSPKPGGATSPKRGGVTSPGPGGRGTSGPAGTTTPGSGAGATSGPGGATGPARSGAASSGPGAVSIPGLPHPAPVPGTRTSSHGPTNAASSGPGTQSGVSSSSAQATLSADFVAAKRMPATVKGRARRSTARPAGASASPYEEHIPAPVKNAFVAMARAPLIRAQPLYRDVASHSGIRWELLAACDWMQCRAKPRLSPVHGEKLGAVNADGTTYRTKSAALEQCADDLAELADVVYQIDLTAPGFLSVRDLANVFGAFRWGALLRLHRTSAMEFPYSVEGLTIQHMHMRWPNIDAPHAPDKPGGRFHMPFGAVPVVLGLDYPATA